MEVSHKGSAGLLQLEGDGLRWRARGVGPELRVGWAEIKLHCVSASSSARALLKLVTSCKDPKAPGLVFQFTSRLNAANDRNTVVRAILAGTRPKPEPAPAAEPAAPEPEVIDLTGGRDRLSGLRLEPKRKLLTAGEMAVLLAERPGLRAEYEATVPLIKSERRFWSEYLASAQLHGPGSLPKPASPPRERVPIASELDLSTELKQPPSSKPTGVIAQLNKGARDFVQKLAPRPREPQLPVQEHLAPPPAARPLQLPPAKRARPAKRPEQARPDRRPKIPLGRPVRLASAFGCPEAAHEAISEVVAMAQPGRARESVPPEEAGICSKVRADRAGSAGRQGFELLRHFWAAEGKRQTELLEQLQRMRRELSSRPTSAPIQGLCAQLERACSSSASPAGVPLDAIAAKAVERLQQAFTVVS